MFCSKCGKELPEGAMFCPSCGGSVNGTNPVPPAVTPSPANYRSANTGISAKEKKKKAVAISEYILYITFDLVFFWSLVVSDGQIALGEGIDSLPDGEEYHTFFLTVFIVLAVFFTLYDIFIVFKVCIIPCIKRSFDKNRRLVFSSMISGLSTGIASIVSAFVVNENLGYFPSSFVAWGTAVTTLSIVAYIFYIVAANYEREQIILEKEAAYRTTLKHDEAIESRYEKRYTSNLARLSGEPQEEYWICPECGTRNRLLSDQCKDCGKYR